MLNRRTLLKTTALGAVLAALPASIASASGSGSAALTGRVATLDLDSHLDFLSGVRAMASRDREASIDALSDGILSAHGMTSSDRLGLADMAGRGAGVPVAAAFPDPIDRGEVASYRRLPTVHAEGVLDFLWGVETYNGSAHAAAANHAADAILVSAGIAGTAPVDLEQAIGLFAHDPVIASRYKAYLDSQRLKMKLVSAAYAPHRDHFLDRMDLAAGQGPGTLTLDSDFVVPAYARHELHMQPGGYVGDDLAGYVFRHAIVGLYSGHNFENQTHESIASSVPVPADGKVRRVLDLGCGIGQLALAMKHRFPDAEIWGIDTSAPMLRYAHLHATELGVAVHYAQQSAEVPQFPTDHFDVVTASGLFHEIAPEATHRIIGQVARILRPGGTFFPLDMYTGGDLKPKLDAKSRFATWISARWYHEDWRNDYGEIDLPGALREAGLNVIEQGPALRLGPVPMTNMMAVKRA